MKRLPVPISFDWDQGNVDKNWGKHKVHYKEIEEVFLNKPSIIFRDTKHSQKENRYTALGHTNKGRWLHISFTIRNKMIRAISARSQSKRERRIYAKEEK